MKIAVNAEQLVQDAPGGIGRYTARLLDEFRRLAPDDNFVPFVAAHPRPSVMSGFEAAGIGELEASTVMLPLPRPVLYDSWHSVRLPTLAACNRALRGLDVVFAPSLAVPPVPATVSLVVTVHDLAPRTLPEVSTPRGRRFHESGLRWALRRADRLICVSQATADELLAETGVDPGRVVVIPNGVDPNVARVAEIDAAKAAHELNRPYVLWVGSLEPRKNLPLLIEAFARIERTPAPLLVLVGAGGWGDPGLERALGDRPELRPRVRALGRVDDARLQALYAGAAAVAFPSLGEGFGLPVAEAMAAGTPVVASAIDVHREVSAGAAVLAPLGDADAWAGALSAILSDRMLGRRLGARGRARAAQLSWRRCAKETLSVLHAAGRR